MLTILIFALVWFLGCAAIPWGLTYFPAWIIPAGSIGVIIAMVYIGAKLEIIRRFGLAEAELWIGSAMMWALATACLFLGIGFRLVNLILEYF
jgi:hypothetical protein